MLVHYIVKDKTGARAKKWLSFRSDQRWDFSLLAKDLMGDKARGVYTDLSNYCHPHAAGTSKFIRELEKGISRFERGAIKDFALAKKQIFYISNSAIGIIETLNTIISPSQKWVEKHDEIIGSNLFYENYIKEIEPKIAGGDKEFLEILNKLD